MTNRELSIILRLKDEATKRLEGVKGALQRFANSWKKNWLAITAAITASIMALRKAWDLMELGAKAEQQRQAFNNLAESVGMSADKIIEDLRRMSGETMSTSQIMEKASQAIILGIDPTKLSKMMEISRASARAFGKDVGFMFESIAIGVGRQSNLILDSLGIIVGAGDAYEKYAKTIGKSTKELTEMERKQAFLNATLEAGERIINMIDTSTMTNLEKMQKLKAGWRDLAEKIGKALWHVLGFIQGFMNQIVSGFFKLLEVASTVFKKLLVPFQKFYELLGRLPGHMGETYRRTADNIKKLSDDIEENRRVFELASKESAKEAVKQYDLVFAKVKETGDKTAELLKNAGKHVAENAKEAKKQFNALHEFVKGTARNMESAFSNLFFKAFTGELKNIKEVFEDFGRAMLQTISNILAKLIVIKMFTAMAGPGGNIFGVPLAQLFHKGGVVRERAPVFIKAHSGLSPDEVPIIAQKGEGVLSKEGMSALGGSDNLRALNRGERLPRNSVTININQVIQAWSAEDVWRNRRMLSEAVADDIYSNGKVRSVIRNLT